MFPSALSGRLVSWSSALQSAPSPTRRAPTSSKTSRVGSSTSARPTRYDSASAPTSRHRTMTQMAGVGDGDRHRQRTNPGQIVQPLRQPFVHVEHPGRESSSLGRTQQVAVVLQRRSASGRVDQDRNAVVEIGDDLPGPFPSLGPESGMRGQRAATRCARAGRVDTHTGRWSRWHVP